MTAIQLGKSGTGKESKNPRSLASRQRDTAVPVMLPNTKDRRRLGAELIERDKEVVRREGLGVKAKSEVGFASAFYDAADDRERMR